MNTASRDRRWNQPLARTGRLSRVVFWLALCGAAAARPASQPSTATIDVDAAVRVGRVWPEIMGINLDYGGRAALSNPATMDAVRRIALRSIRFPNGCEADRYDWRAENNSKMSVEQFLAFCDAVGAEPYYTLNLQGGTEDKQGKPPAGAGIDEVIRYRHTAPNPCGYTDYHYGTLAEVLEFVRKYTIGRALAGQRPILCYEMGNENWGQGKTDWPPEHYAATVAAYARAMRDLVAEAARAHAPLKDLRLWITAVGYPMVGNNQDPTQPVDGEVNVRWTRELNALAAAGLIDAVQDHFYPYAADGTSLLVWSHHNLQNILYARRGLANPNLGGRVEPDVAFRMPIEITEWNVKCWGGPGSAPASVDTAAQQLFLVDAFRIMIEHGIRRAHLHHLFGGYACGIMLPDGRTKENYKVFRFLAGRLGTERVRTAVACGTFDYDCPADARATDFNAIPPDVKNVPLVSALAMRDERSLYVLAINRSTDKAIEATIRVRGARLGGGDVRSLTCADFDAREVELKECTLEAAREPTWRLEPHAAYAFRFALSDG